MEKPGLARPWMLAWRADFGTAGLCDPDTFQDLLELILSEGFLSDPDQLAAEKLSCVAVTKSWLVSPYEELPELVEHLLPPFSLGYLKGWKRSLGLLLSLAAIRELNLEHSISHHIKVTQIASQ